MTGPDPLFRPESATDGGEPSRVTARLVLACCGAALGGFMFGFDTAVVNGTVDAVEARFAIGPALLGAIVAGALFGAAVGALVAGSLAARAGRRATMLVAGALFVTTSILCGVASTAVELAAWRMLGGVGVGLASVVGPLYLAEVAPARVRGRLASLQQMAIVVGILAALLSNAALVRIAGGAEAELFGTPAWRWMFLVGAVPSLVYLLVALVLPESPRHLMARGRRAAARSVVARLHGVDEQAADRLVGTMPTPSPRAGDIRSGWGRLPPVVWVGIAIAALQALVGIDVIFYYSTSLWAQVGFGEEQAFWLSAFTSLVNVLATVVAIALIDRVGRRRLLLVGSVGMTLTLATMSFGLSRAEEVGDGLAFGGGWGVVTLVAANLFVVAFAVSWGPVVWVLVGELFPFSVRARAASLAATANWVAGIAVNLTFPSLRELSLPGSYALYAAFAAVSWVLVWWALPETANRRLEEVGATVSAQHEVDCGDGPGEGGHGVERGREVDR